jgi:hypothetical protein
MQSIAFVHRGTEHRFEIPFMDQASVSNAMSCLCALVALERWDEAHLAKFRVLPRLENRLQFMAGRFGNYVLNDSYSADLESLGVALDMLKRQSPNLPLVVILGRFEQTGMDAVALRARLLEVVKGFGVDEVIWVGREYAGMAGMVFEDTEALLGSGWLAAVSGRAILVKGSRSSGMERVVSRLQARLLQTRLEIHLGALKHNFLHFKRLAGEGKLRANLEAQVDRMMRDARFEGFIRNFVGQWLQARDVETAQIDSRQVLTREAKPDPDFEAKRARFTELRRKPETELTAAESAWGSQSGLVGSKWACTIAKPSASKATASATDGFTVTATRLAGGISRSSWARTAAGTQRGDPGQQFTPRKSAPCARAVAASAARVIPQTLMRARPIM